jgi:hypothetical protein
VAQNPVVEKLVYGAVERCRERIASATKRIDQGIHRHEEMAVRREPASFTGSLKRFRGL